MSFFYLIGTRRGLIRFQGLRRVSNCDKRYAIPWVLLGLARVARFPRIGIAMSGQGFWKEPSKSVYLKKKPTSSRQEQSQFRFALILDGRDVFPMSYYLGYLVAEGT